MRIWSKKLIQVLPTKQLKAMRYELGDMIKQYPNIKHSLVKFANDYDIAFLGEYFGIVLLECLKRNINMNEKYNIEISNIVFDNSKLETEEQVGLKFKEDNDRYLKQCLYNLQEKYDRNIITKEEWQKIENLFKEVI